MLGKWEANHIQTTDVYESYLVDYQLEFIYRNRLKLCMQSPHDAFCADLTYELVDGKTYKVENERTKGGYWEISRTEDNLIICLLSNENCILFERDTLK